MSHCSKGVKIAGDFIGFGAKGIDDINKKYCIDKAEKIIKRDKEMTQRLLELFDCTRMKINEIVKKYE